ncbi:ABC transporter permease [Granulicella sibirica]|uniref:ABC transporter permease n=1 Tax=Granulicella sibirica TaxID=2479048 RepID=A0A4Q0T037_9BACT|nr:ABC transporter permease [Granulicella sibirica]RXH55670.1 hypothetical protein GRAN_2527 [Granulicella sibirica]
MKSIFQDLRFSIRQLLKSPGFALTAIFSLALGIGATTAVFSVVHAILVDPYPYAKPERMAHLRLEQSPTDNRGANLSFPQWQQLRKSPAVEDAFITDNWSLTVTGHDLPEDVNGSFLSSNAFNFLGVPALYGRGLIPADAIDGQDPQPVVVLGYKFWQRHFNSDPTVVGHTLQLVRKNYTIVGVANPRFTWDDGDVYLPLKITQDQVAEHYVGIRLKPGISLKAGTEAIAPLIEQFQKETPKHFPTGGHYKFRLYGLNEDTVQNLGGTLYLLFSAVVLLLAIGCGNVSILLLARGAGRRHELALRVAIGATRGRLIRQMLTEAVLLSATGAALGILLAYRSLAFIIKQLPEYSFPHEAAIRLDIPVLAFSVVLALLTGVLFGLWPALQLSRPNIGEIIQSGSRKVAGSLSGKATNNALIATQIALTLLLLAGAGASIQGFLKIMHAPLGYDPHNVMSVGIPVHENTYPTWEARSTYFNQLQKKISEVPGVTMTAISTNATPPANGWETAVQFLGKPTNDDQKVRINFVSPNYFPVLGVPRLQGRIWDETENLHGLPLVVINETMAKLYFPNGDAVGHALKIPDLHDAPPYNLVAPGAEGWLQIIGIVADKRDDGLRKPILPEAFIPYTLSLRMWTQILVRSSVPPLTLLHAVGSQVISVDPDQQISGNIQDLEQWITGQQEYQQEHLVALLFGAFALLALILAAVGLYSVVSYTVAQRTNEFGIRLALGAQRTHVLQIVFASTTVSVGTGLAAGVALTLALNKLLSHWAEGSSHDPLILLLVTVVLCTVAAIACALPASRASLIDPVEALRH